MECRFLNQYRPAVGDWSVASCLARFRMYVPSVGELKNYCTRSNHKKCPFYCPSVGEAKAASFSPAKQEFSSFI